MVGLERVQPSLIYQSWVPVPPPTSELFASRLRPVIRQSTSLPALGLSRRTPRERSGGAARCPPRQEGKEAQSVSRRPSCSVRGAYAVLVRVSQRRIETEGLTSAPTAAVRFRRAVVHERLFVRLLELERPGQVVVRPRPGSGYRVEAGKNNGGRERRGTKGAGRGSPPPGNRWIRTSRGSRAGSCAARTPGCRSAPARGSPPRSRRARTTRSSRGRTG